MTGHVSLETDPLGSFAGYAFDAIHTLQREARQLTEANARLAQQKEELSQDLALCRMRLEEVAAQLHQATNKEF